MCEDMIYSNFHAISIPCHYLDGECFDFGNCDNCKYKFREEKRMTITELRESTGTNQKQFAAWFNIPLKTVQNWEYGRSTPPVYVIEMIKTIINHSKSFKIIESENTCKFDVGGQCVLCKSDEDGEELYD